MSVQTKQTADELYLELTEAGIDVDGTVAVCKKVEASHIEASGQDVSSITNISVTYRAELLEEEQTLGAKMRSLVTILALSFTGALVASGLLFFGPVLDQPWLFVTRSAVVLLLALAVFSLLVLLHNLWLAFLVERKMRTAAEERCTEVQEKFSIATGMLKALS